MTNPDGSEITQYFHCKKCILEKLKPKIGVGWTLKGLQVYCENHDINIINLDFRGQRIELA